MHNAVMCTFSLYDVIGITRHLHIKLKSFSNIAQHLHKEAIRGCLFFYIISKKSVIMSEAFIVDVCIYCTFYTFSSYVKVLLSKDNLFKKNTFDFTTAGDCDCVAVIVGLPALHYTVDFLSFGIT